MGRKGHTQEEDRQTQKPRAFLICPVRGITDEYADGIRAQVEMLERGYQVHWPMRDTNQSAGSLQICEQNRAAIQASDVVFIAWDGKSQGCLFDLGMAFAMGKRVRAIIGYTPAMTIVKSYANFIFEYEQVTA
jgi:nucleoside 2-deoxyribosyltransferase